MRYSRVLGFGGSIGLVAGLLGVGPSVAAAPRLMPLPSFVGDYIGRGRRPQMRPRKLRGKRWVRSRSQVERANRRKAARKAARRGSKP